MNAYKSKQNNYLASLKLFVFLFSSVSQKRKRKSYQKFLLLIISYEKLFITEW